MKRTVILAAVIVALPAAFGGLILRSLRSQSPEALLARLASGKGDREDLIMRLNVARGDTVGPMIGILQDTSTDPSFRAEVLELLLKRNHRSREDRIEEAIAAATKDPEPIVRRKAAYGLAVYAGPRLQVAMVNSLADPDAQVRRQAYMTFGSHVWHQMDPEEGLWQLLSAPQRDKLIKVCLERMKTEKTPEMRLMARAVVGREIEIRGYNATRALQTSDTPKAEELLRGALELDPANHQGQVRLVRFHLKTGNKEKALALAREYGALFEIPRLSQAPAIDGDPTDAVWGEAFTTERFWNDSRWAPQQIKGKAKACVGHRDGKIYIAMLGYEEDLTRLVQKHKVRDSDVWRDDCFELIFDPANTERDVYQFVINPAGALFDQANNDSKKNFKCQCAAAVFRDRGYWACEFALEGKDLDNHPIQPGAMWSLNLFHTRVGAASECGQIWPTFGHAHRVNLYPLALFK